MTIRSNSILLVLALPLLVACPDEDHSEPDRLLPGSCVETYTRSNPGNLDRVLESVHTWEGDRLKVDQFYIDGDLWGEAEYFYSDDGTIDYRIDLGYRVDYVYEDGRLVETVSEISRVEFDYDEQGRKASEHYYAIDEMGAESFERAVVFTYDGPTVIHSSDNDTDHSTVGGGTHYIYRTDDHQILEREEVRSSDGTLVLSRTYEHDSFGNRLSGVVEDFEEDDRNLEGDITFDYSCF